MKPVPGEDTLLRSSACLPVSLTGKSQWPCITGPAIFHLLGKSFSLLESSSIGDMNEHKNSLLSSQWRDLRKAPTVGERGMTTHYFRVLVPVCTSGNRTAGVF